jgi:hypothetical protein
VAGWERVETVHAKFVTALDELLEGDTRQALAAIGYEPVQGERVADWLARQHHNVPLHCNRHVHGGTCVTHCGDPACL